MQKNAAIVLGGGLTKIRQNGQIYYRPANQVRNRLDQAIQLYKDNKVDYIVTTGNYSKRVGLDSSVKGPKTEAQVSQKYLLDKLADYKSKKELSKWLLFEDKSFDTLGNAWYAKKICLEPNQITKCTIITSDYHMERSELIFKWVLGDTYKLNTISIASEFDDKHEREVLEKIFTDYFKQWLIPNIKAGDDTAIEDYFYNEHLIYSMSARSEALFNACMKTAAIKSGY